MDNTASAAPLKTAAELWIRLVKNGTLKPRDYDEDIVTSLEAQLPGLGTLPQRMTAEGWTARDLLRGMLPVVNSFAELMKNLLELYARISASQGTEENLVISYEFEENNPIDQSLAEFRRAVATLNRAQSASGIFVLPKQQKNYFPSQLNRDDIGKIHDMREGGGDWSFTLPAPPKVKDPRLARGVSSVYKVLTAACDELKRYGATMDAVSKNPALSGSPSHAKLSQDFRDYFPEMVIFRIRKDVKYLENRPFEEVDTWLRSIEEWCSLFWKTEELDAETELESVLSLPMWGKRHELYSAWVVCLIAKAFEGQKLQFRVVNRKLSFPFKPTKVASFEDQLGPVELWSEVRSAASGDLAHGRKGGVQPDYRFLRPDQKLSDTEMVIEVKQYRKVAGARHGRTARDYARALPKAKVAIVAHGPIGGSAKNYVDESDERRVTIHEHVRSLDSLESKALIEDLSQVFPRKPYLFEFNGVQASVDEVEIRLIEFNQERNIITYLKPGEVLQELEPFKTLEIFVRIVCHPDKWHTIDNAGICVSLTFNGGKVRHFEPIGPCQTRSWYLGSLNSESFFMKPWTVEKGLGE